jgi:two-component system OmpR family sensor kinase
MSARNWLRPRVIWARASLRSRVLLIAVVLLTAGFTAFSLVTGNALRSYMADRVDAQLRASAQVFALLPSTVARTGTGTGGKPPPGLTDFSTEVLGNPVITYVTKNGTVESSIDSLAGAKRTEGASGPDLPRLDASAVAARAGKPFTVAGTSGDTRWRSIAVPRVVGRTLLGGRAAGSVIVSAPMSQVDGTVDRMWHIYETTGLGLLAQLETAFAARAESEARMTRFVADASHELRTPLAGIKGLTDLHRMGALADREDIDATMARIARESDRLARLVADMLLLARFDEHSLGTTGEPGPALELAPTDLRTLAADALHAVRALDATRPVALTGPDGVGAPASAPALADEARLRQVVTNLVGNAVAHTPPGTAIRIGVGTVGEDAVLEVADEGPGLTPAQTAHVFERFYRADTSRTRATGGAGLGLAIVDSLVTAHAGRVEIDSAPGRGATFRVRLPLHADHSELRAPAGVLG